MRFVETLQSWWSALITFLKNPASSTLEESIVDGVRAGLTIALVMLQKVANTCPGRLLILLILGGCLLVVFGVLLAC